LTRRILGVDPGCYGALVLFDQAEPEGFADMPILKVRRGKSDKAEVDGHALARAIKDFKPDVLVIEQVGGMTGQSASAAFNFGRAAGAPEYTGTALGLRVERVAPITWKKALKVNPGKDGSRFMAMRLWPNVAGWFARVKDDGRAEAALIAHWFWLKNGGENAVSKVQKMESSVGLHDGELPDAGVFAR
jgi:crossover junction endodeoxyribonuclease RuvC